MSGGIQLNSANHFFKVTVHIGMNQNIEIEIFTEYKSTLNELLIKIMFFNTSNSLQDMTNRRFLLEVKLYVGHILGVNFLRHVLAKTATMQRSNTPSIFNLMSSDLAS